MSKVQRPKKATDDVGDDLLLPTTDFLEKVGLLPDAAKPDRTEGKADTVDNSLEVTKAAKNFTQIATGAGGGVGFIAAFLAAVQGQSDVVVAALAIATAAIIVAGVYGVARVTDGDVRGRSSVATAAMEARAEVIRALLSSYDVVAKDPAVPGDQAIKDTRLEELAAQSKKINGVLPLFAALTATGSGAKIETESGPDSIEHVRWTSTRGLQVKLASQDVYVSVEEAKLIEK